MMEVAVNLLTLEGEGGGGGGDGSGLDVGMEMEGERGVALSGKELVSPFIPRLLEYLSRVIGDTVGKGGRVREGRGGELETEFVVLSR